MPETYLVQGTLEEGKKKQKTDLKNVIPAKKTLGDRTIDYLTTHLDSGLTAGMRSGLALKMAVKKPYFFSRKNIEGLLEGMKNPKAIENCDFALGWLHRERPDLFRKGDGERMGKLEQENQAYWKRANEKKNAKVPLKQRIKDRGMKQLAKNLENGALAAASAATLVSLAVDHPEKFKKEQIRQIAAGMKNEKSAEDCARILAWLSDSRPELFGRKDVELIIAGLKSKKCAENCAAALSYLADLRSELFEKKDIEPIIAGMKNKENPGGCAAVLNWLANKKPEWLSSENKQDILESVKNHGGWEMHRTVIDVIYAINNKDDGTAEKIAWQAEKANFSNIDGKYAGKLRSEFNIEYALRYPESILEEMVSKSGKKDDRPIALVAYPKNDWNGSLYNSYATLAALKKAGFRVMVFESGNQDEYGRMGTELTKRYGKASLLVLVEHSNEESILLGKTFDVSDRGNLDMHDTGIYHTMTGWLTRSAKIVINACDAGKGKENIARTISIYTGANEVDVFASDQAAGQMNVFTRKRADGKPELVTISYADGHVVKYHAGVRVASAKTTETKVASSKSEE
ncbi:Uncharacterised protein [Candidatus Gugararchaeum adminiculabundum]|nr:Uncharacterised protein [Candidatus Gugararchaeum adminiculabundum]